MKKIRVAVVGLGNIGRFAVEAVRAAPDMELAGVVRRVKTAEAEENFPVATDVAELG